MSWLERPCALQARTVALAFVAAAFSACGASDEPPADSADRAVITTVTARGQTIDEVVAEVRPTLRRTATRAAISD